MNPYYLLQSSQRQRVSDGSVVPLDQGWAGDYRLLLVWPQLGDFDSLEYAWWIQRQRSQLQALGVTVRAVGIGDRGAGQRFCDYSGFPGADLFVDPQGELHQQLGLYPGLQVPLPGVSPRQRAMVNLLLMCAGVGSPGTLGEVFRGYWGDRRAPQLIADDEVVEAKPLPPLRGSVFRWAGGQGFQRPFELATLRLRNMAEVLSHWSTYVPDGAQVTQRGGTFLWGATGELLYEHRDRGLLGFSASMGNPLQFLDQFLDQCLDPAVSP
ncbi:peroxiredoxin-like family protein [Prochlorothrix hollandica]|uniref:Uncharacterized protein n=1 Tax=Prochlorothrix hollandica PCC 9006 = CALU 1027 TaxID=317619 RepID=A0A0M2PXN0_PROHO|nr:peroxiredoxin-like family protein [Prochlorothrix hollandica]KKI99832.1 hypothetical protein PROH_08280 [Prochlorothrix hollandica PCC 9006 = CALU 1027]